MDVESDSLHRAAALFANARRAVAFTGAGISTPSGIPDFRSTDCGLWNNTDPLTVASIHGFRQNPEAFYHWIQPLARLTLEARPNTAHLTLVDLENRGILKAIITQNIDMLHGRAGSRSVFELHGHMREATCIHCFRVYPGEPLLAQFAEDGCVPRCSQCGSTIKPNVILFGEQLPVRELLAAKDAARQADLLMIIGSSLEVAPASDIPILAARSGAKIVIINLEATHLDSMADVVIRGNAADVLPQILYSMERML